MLVRSHPIPALRRPTRRQTLSSLLALPLWGSSCAAPAKAGWQTLQASGSPTARHECGFVQAGDKFYLIGGRGRKAVDVYDPKRNAWSEAAQPPIEIHHFQPVAYKGKIYIVGALTGKYPAETPVPEVLIYDPKTDAWNSGPEIPSGRRRGAVGTAVFGNKIYLACGIVDGHRGDYVAWLDEFDPRDGSWRKLPDAPRPRDHFHAGIVDGRLYAAGGRTSSQKTGQTFELTIPEVDAYDFESNRWTTLADPLPTMRAGTSTVVAGDRLIVIGGESAAQKEAHSEVEAYNAQRARWETLPPLEQGRHGTGAASYRGDLYTAAGSGNRGGGPELTSIESLPEAKLASR